MQIKRLSDSVFQIIETEGISSRKLFKLNIYLNSMKNAEVNDKDNIITINYLSDNSAEILHSFLELYDFLNSLFPSIELSQDLKDILKKKQEEEKKGQELLKVLRQVKDSNPDGEEQYEKFKKFCDSTLVIQLRPYQYRSAYLLSLGKGGFDFSVPGAGKTIITYATYAYLKHMRIVDEIFIVGPLSSYNAWQDEHVTCFGQEPDFISLASASTKDCKIYLSASSKNHKKVTFINVEKIRLLWREISGYLDAAHVLLVIDEAHKIKAPNAKSTQAANELARHATARILLTGTPMPNGYEDLFSLMKVFSPFNQILPFGYGQLKALTKNGASQAEVQRIRNSIKPYYSRISKKYLLETGELKAPSFSRIKVKMDEKQRELYDKLNSFCKKLNDNLDEDFLMAMKKAALIRKMQISSNPLLLKKGLMESMDELYTQYVSERRDAELLISADHQLMDQLSGSLIAKTVNLYANGSLEPKKNQKAVELVTELVNRGEKVLVWDIFVQNMVILKNMLEKAFPDKVELINGNVNPQDRQLVIHRFREGGSLILIANPATLAESISLHKACQSAVYVNRNFNCAQYIQSKDRIHRINMPTGKTAQYYILMNEDCVDESVDERLTIKENRMLKILDSEELIVGGSEYDDVSIMSDQDVDISYRR